MRAGLAATVVVAMSWAGCAAAQPALVCAFGSDPAAGRLAGQVVPWPKGAVGDACNIGKSHGGVVRPAADPAAATPIVEREDPNSRSAPPIYDGRPAPKCTFDDGTSAHFAGPPYPAPSSRCTRLKRDRAGMAVRDAAGRPVLEDGVVY